MFKKFLLLLMIVFATGCGLQARTYVMTKERVGIEKGSGNAGYLSGTPQYVEPQKKTRQVYVLEITKPVPESEVKKIEQAATSATPGVGGVTPAPTKVPGPAAPVSVPVEKVPAVEQPVAATTYTVQKDDTLQKIAKKFYGSYGKWVKIYEANKKKIKNPNYLRPGTVLTIPEK